MNDGDALLTAILAHPEDDTARLVYADWLEEHGEADRGEFIRVQVELAKHDDSIFPGQLTRIERAVAEVRCGLSIPYALGHSLATTARILKTTIGRVRSVEDKARRKVDFGHLRRVAGLRRRERELLGCGRDRWFDCWLHSWTSDFGPPGVTRYYTTESDRPHVQIEFRRGFVDAVTLSAEDAVAHLDAVLAAHPIREVTLTTWPDLATFSALVAGCPGLAPWDGRPLVGVLHYRWPRIKKENWHLPANPFAGATRTLGG